MTTLPALLSSPDRINLPRVRALLDGIAPADQYTVVQTLGRKQQVRLFELAATADPVTRDDLLPPSTPAAGAVVHHGWNSLPMFRSWRRFQKPMARLDGGQELGGYNEGSTRWLIGPGYFVCRPSAKEYAERGAWVVDYLRIPEVVPHAGWPELKPNESGLQRFVFAGTRDYLRKVTDGVLIGMPFKGDKQLPFPFLLVRER